MYTSRENKPEWVVSIFKEVFQDVKKVLDIGCDQKQLKKILSGDINYIGVDISGMPDVLFNFDKEENLPFEDKSYDLVFCSEVLEHLENIHFIFDELCRLSKKYIIISLPNPLSGIFAYLFGKKYAKTTESKEFGKFIKYYGLPIDKPKDRHRWFFSTEEALEFVSKRAEKNNCKIEKVLYTIDFQRGIRKVIKIMLSGFSRKRMLNLFNGTTWFLIRKK